MTPARFKKHALSLEGVREVPHMDRLAYRTKRKIFATLGADGRVNLIVQPADRREALLEAFPGAIASLGGWTRLGYLAVDLARAPDGLVLELLTEAWRDAQPVATKPKTAKRRKIR